jgi:hypothetical protein
MAGHLAFLDLYYKKGWIGDPADKLRRSVDVNG